MKKLFFTTALFLFSMFSFAQSSQPSPNPYPCDDQSTLVSTRYAGDWCVSVAVKLTFILEVDINLLNATNNTLKRKPSPNEAFAFDELLCGPL